MQLDSGSIIKPTRPRRKQASSALAEEERSDGADTTTTKPVRRRRQKSVDGQLDVEPPTVPQRSKRRRRIHKTTAEDDSDGADSDSKKKKRRRKSTSISRSQQGRTESVAPFDADADPGEELDPTVVRMADLCEDTGQGRISSKAAQIFENHSAWKRSNRERRSRMKVIMEAKKYGRNEDDTNGPAPVPEIAGPIVDGTPEAGPSKSRSPSHVVQVQDGDGTHSDDGLDGFDYSQAVATSKFNVQVRIGPNGETIVDEESLFVDRGEEAETGDYTHVEESDATKFVNSATYGKKYRGSRWSAEETELFYDALSQFGENYELISYVLPGRDRKSCKNKFKSEDKRDPKRITHCLNNRVPYDMQTLSRMTGKDFSGPTPVIRAKTPPNLAQMDVDGSPTSVQNQKSGQGDAVDEAVSPSSLKRSSSGPPSHKKKGKRKEDDGVEVLGAADGIWD
ncbi:hypothetical protein OF83DRAFT_1054422 [Amylostereum chailletii]|nr:hypothetical protein OF83DRAFT_1054422 [Amylostereum chailletii]